MLEVEGQGKNIEKAIEDALFQLKAPREDVDIKILDQGGFMKKARVQVSISEDSLHKYQKNTEKSSAVIEKPAAKEEKETGDDGKLDVKSLFIKVEEKKQKEAEKAYAAAVKEEKKEEKKAAKSEEKKEKKEYKKEEGDSAVCFLRGLIKEMGIADAEIVESEQESVRKIEVKGKDVGKLVGYRGETLGAIQTLLSSVDREDNEGGRRLLLDVDGYLAKREQTLVALAGRMAHKVMQTGRPVKLEPMTANERRIIHTALQNEEGVETISKGQEPSRFLMIIPKK